MQHNLLQMSCLKWYLNPAFFLYLQAHGDTSFNIYTGGFFYDDFVWAVSAVMSRQNEIPQKDVKLSQLALIPLWDMCNHWMGELCALSVIRDPAYTSKENLSWL